VARNGGAEMTRPTAAPPRRRSGGGTILLPPWTRAPLLGMRQPAVLLAVIGAAAILACASSSAALFLSSASSASLQRLIAARCPDAAYPAIQSKPADRRLPGRDGRAGAALTATLDRQVPAAMTANGLPAPYRVLQNSDALVTQGTAGPGATSALVYETGALSHVTRLAGSASTRGVWIHNGTARLLGLHVGSTATVGTAKVRVAGIYRDLATQPVAPFWCSQTALFLNQSYGNDTPPPHLVLATDPQTFLSITARNQDLPVANWISPITTHRITLDAARRVNASERSAMKQLGGTAAAASRAGAILGPQGGGYQQSLPDMTSRTSLIRRGLTGPVVPIAVGGSVLALLLVGAAGSYWADRRQREVRLLSSRGVGPGALAVKAALELTIPAVIGTVLGWVLAVELVRVIGPSADLDSTAPLTAAVTALIALLVGVGLLSAVAGLRARDATERPLGHGRGWAAVVPWELIVLAVAGVLYLRLHSEQAVVLRQGVAQVNLLLVAFPLLFLLGGAVLLVRLLALTLPWLRRSSAGWGPASYFAVRRITGAVVVSVTLLVAASLPVAVFVYSAAITRTSQVTVDAKAGSYAGSTVDVSTVDKLHRTPALDAVGTIVTRYSQVTLGADDAEVLAVDPATFARYAFWDDRFADRPLPTLMRDLTRRPADGRLPAIVLTYQPNHSSALQLGRTSRRLDVVARPTAFPGQQNASADLVVVDAALLGHVDHFVVNSDELWSTHSAAAAQAAMTAQHARPFVTFTPHGVVDATNYLAVTWSFGYLQALAALVGLIAIGGLLLYLATRQRSRIASYAMGRRMGLTRRAHLRSLLIELGALLAAAWLLGAGLAVAAVYLVYARLDVDPTRRPPPLLTLPVIVFVTSAAVIAVVVLLAAFSAQHSADRADISEVMRLDG
jgi:putative ABC transport system permease protein